MPDPELIKWWEEIHTTKNKDLLSADLVPLDQWNYLQITDLIIAKTKILYIGVGAVLVQASLSKTSMPRALK